MNRRSVLAAAVGTAAASLGGCLEAAERTRDAVAESAPASLSGGSPWGDGPVVVAVGYRTDERREEFESLVRSALDYWEANAERYAGYEISYDLRPDAPDPDVRIVLVDEVATCSAHDSDHVAVGCAPLITGSPPETARVQIKDGYSRRVTETTIRHEIGHTLGLDHDDEPTEIMSDDPADRVPDYERRRAVHERYYEGVEAINAGHEAWDDGRVAWNDERWEGAATSFEAAAASYREAAGRFETARDGADEVGVDDAAAQCADALAYAEGYADAADEMRAAAEAMAADDRAAARDRHADSEDSRREAAEREVAPSDEVAKTLGIQ